MWAAIGQFSGPYSTVRPPKIWSYFYFEMFRDLSPSVLNFYSN